MPRPKRMTTRLFNMRLTERDRKMIELMAEHPDTPTFADVVRVAVRKLYESRKRKESKELPLVS